MVEEAWVTAEEVLAAKSRLEDAIAGWRKPAAHALGVVVGDDPVTWRVLNYPNRHELPAVVLATVVGYTNGSATYWLGLDQFDEAIRILQPAGACDAFDHPNLWAWQDLRSEISDGRLPASARVVAVFIGDEADPPIDAVQSQLGSAIGLTR